MKNSKMIFMVVAALSMGLVAEDNSSVVDKATEAMKSAGNKVVEVAKSVTDTVVTKAAEAGTVVQETLVTAGTAVKESYIAQAAQEDANDKAMSDSAKNFGGAVSESVKNVGVAVKESFVAAVEKKDAIGKVKEDLFENAMKAPVAPAPVAKEATTPVAPTLFERTKAKMNEAKDFTVKSANQAYTYTKENPVFVGSIATVVVLTAAAVTYYVYQQSDVDNDTEISNN